MPSPICKGGGLASMSSGRCCPGPSLRNRPQPMRVRFSRNSSTPKRAASSGSLRSHFEPATPRRKAAGPAGGGPCQGPLNLAEMCLGWRRLHREPLCNPHHGFSRGKLGNAQSVWLYPGRQWRLWRIRSCSWPYPMCSLYAPRP